MRRALALVPFVALLALAAGSASQADVVVNSTTYGFGDTTNPCNGESGTLTVIGNSIFHVTFFANGDESWATGTITGQATITPTNPSGVSASGHFTAWFGGAVNNKNEVEHSTNTVHLKGSDGSRVVIHGNSHTSTNASGEVTVTFEKERVTCG